MPVDDNEFDGDAVMDEDENDEEEEQQEDLYELICQRYEKKSLIITSNRDMSEWISVFNNPLIATAAIDRLVHKGIEITLEGNSYRLEQFRRRTKKTTKN